MTMRARASAVALALVCFGACAPPKPATVSLRLQGNENDALVTIDDQLLGPVSRIEKKGVALPVGKHRITIEKVGFFPFDELLVVKDGDKPISLDVKLEKIPE